MFKSVTENTNLKISSTIKFKISGFTLTTGTIIELPRKGNEFKFQVAYTKVNKTRGDSLGLINIERKEIRQIFINKKWFLNNLWYV